MNVYVRLVAILVGAICLYMAYHIQQETWRADPTDKQVDPRPLMQRLILTRNYRSASHYVFALCSLGLLIGGRYASMIGAAAGLVAIFYIVRFPFSIGTPYDAGSFWWAAGFAIVTLASLISVRKSFSKANV